MLWVSVAVRVTFSPRSAAADGPLGRRPVARSVYTGKTGEPCCLCGREETATRVDLPPRAIPRMKHSGPIAWRDVEGEVSVHFCAEDWATVRDLVLDAGMSPLGRCNAARADFDLRADFEALSNDRREQPDHGPVERRLLDRARETGSEATDRERVQAWLVRAVLAEERDADTDATDGVDAGS